jgi:3-carboxy-cis,cis-muconate cycloisomerase
MQGLYENLFYSKKVNELYTDSSCLKYMLCFEAALAKAQAKYDLIPTVAAIVIEECCDVKKIDINHLKEQIALSGNAAIPLVKQLTKVVDKADADASRYVHFGATSQDVIDTTTSLQLKDAISLINDNLDLLTRQLVSLIEAHRDTIMVGRTFLQHARPITFGFKVAGWLDGLLRSKKRIERLLVENLPLQLGGAVATLSGMEGKGILVAEEMCDQLRLNMPLMPWHTQRDRLVEVAAALGILAGNIGKIGYDISLLMQTEVAEVFEPLVSGKGGSSTMPHKRNPVSSISCISIAQRIPPLVSSLLAGMVQDHERATGNWHAEWETMETIVKLAAGSVNQAVNITNGLVVDKNQMKLNLELTKGLIYAEGISLALADKMSKTAAHELVEQCCFEAKSEGKHLKDIVIENPVINSALSQNQVNKIFDPVNSLGLCNEFINRVLSDKY